MKSLKQSLAFVLPCSLLFCTSLEAWAYQEDTGSVPPEVQAARQDVEPTPPPVQQSHQTAEQLQQLVAPIALYPDELVAQILAAATYPAQVVEADRWLQQHRGLKGDNLARAVDAQTWDPSVKALTQFPKVLANLDKNLSWTSQLGDAYINQQQDVMNAVQVLRQQAKRAGHLQSNAQQSVTDQGQTIVIQPADPQVVYVPEYDPWAVYGIPLVPYPLWAPYSGLYIAGPGIDFGVGFGFGLFAGYGWGWHHWGMDWGRHHLMYNHAPFVSHSRTFFERNNFNRGRMGGGPAGGFRGGSSYGNPAFHRSPTGNFGAGTRSSAFSSFNHGGVTRGNSFRGQTSFGGGGFHGGGSFGGGGSRGGGGFGGGGFHGGGGGRR